MNRHGQVQLLGQNVISHLKATFKHEHRFIPAQITHQLRFGKIQHRQTIRTLQATENTFNPMTISIRLNGRPHFGSRHLTSALNVARNGISKYRGNYRTWHDKLLLFSEIIRYSTQ